MSASILQVVAEFRASRKAQDAASAKALLHSYQQAFTRLKGDYHELTGYITAQQQDGRPVKPWKLNQLDRYQQLQMQILRESKILALQAGMDTSILQASMAKLGQQMAHQTAFAGAAAANVPIAGVWNNLPSGAVLELTGALQAGSPLRALIDALETETAEDLEARLIEQLTLGW
ncbi:MAG: hypothetical protein M3P51_08325, partial [Chloroflexota bacterium]|nr:hypothetical protein [Chloroflexota bacterium]